VGLWGLFDISEFSEHATRRVTERALAVRMPTATIQPYAPIGYGHPVSLDGSDTAAQLGRRTPERLADLADQLDCVVVAGAEILRFDDDRIADLYGVTRREAAELAPSRFFVEGLGSELERSTPVVWSALHLGSDPNESEAARMRAALADRPYITVVDDRSRTRVLNAGVGRTVTVVPNPGLLASQTFADGLLDRRLGHLRALGALPSTGPVIVVESTPKLRPYIPMIAAGVERHADDATTSPVLLVIGFDEHASKDLFTELAAATRLPTRHLFSDVVVEDLVSVLARSSAFIGLSATAAAVAASFGRPYALLGTDAQELAVGGSVDRTIGPERGAEHKLAAALRVPVSARDVNAALSRVEDHFDRVVEIATTAALRRADQDQTKARLTRATEFELLQRAHERRGQLLIAERLAFADRSREFITELELERAARVGVEAELAALRSTLTFRVLDPVRRLYARIRRSAER